MKSYCDKAMKEKYINPTEEIQDLAGIRIIAYVNSDVAKICSLIENEFEIDYENSIDKSKLLGIDKVGYKSVHYICKLSEKRSCLRENSMFNGLNFEIQIRTLLQHTWAEIEHDKNYKFSGNLPEKLKRRFSLIAGTLELMDMEFDELSSSIDKYAESVSQNMKDGKIEKILIDSTSLNEYMMNKYKDEIEAGFEVNLSGNYGIEVIEELHDFGIKSLIDLEKMLSGKFTINILEEINAIALLRIYMILSDAEKYFEKCWKKHWDFIETDFLNIFKLNKVNINKYIDKYDIDIE